MRQNQNNQHIPVLLEEVLKYLNPLKGDSYLDLTAGYGGHAEAVLGETGAPEKVVLVDRDLEAVKFLKQKFTGTKVKIMHRDFLAASGVLAASGNKFDVILADLGVSSPHLNNASRGFSIRQEGPLDMRMDQSQTISAELIVNSYSEAALANLIYEYGEDRRAKAIAKAIVAARPITTTTQLANAIANTSHGQGGSKIHPATKTFQALRIVVNQELELLSKGLPLWINLLKPGGRLGIISFHSLEDRIVKQILSSLAGNRYDSSLKLLTKHPVTGNRKEVVFNPRARSAKLRAAVKIKNQERGD